MTHRPSLAEAADRRDITLAMTPTQVVLLALGLVLLLRVLRGMRR